MYRDVSAGNVLRAGQAGKLADLEYANQVDSRTTHEVFMVSRFLTGYDAFSLTC